MKFFKITFYFVMWMGFYILFAHGVIFLLAGFDSAVTCSSLNECFTETSFYFLKIPKEVLIFFGGLIVCVGMFIMFKFFIPSLEKFLLNYFD